MSNSIQKEMTGILWIIAALIAIGDGPPVIGDRPPVIGWAFAACGFFNLLAAVFYGMRESRAEKLLEKIKDEKEGMGV